VEKGKRIQQSLPENGLPELGKMYSPAFFFVLKLYIFHKK